MKLPIIFLLICGLLVTCASPAHAHAFLDQADPKVGSTLKASPPVVRIWFTRDIVPASKEAASSIAVFNAKGEEVDGKDSKIDPQDHALMAVSAPHLPTGIYKVVWKAICRDSHHTTGTYTFVVASSD